MHSSKEPTKRRKYPFNLYIEMTYALCYLNTAIKLPYPYIRRIDTYMHTIYVQYVSDMLAANLINVNLTG